jgi:hypothetical protein
MIINALDTNDDNRIDLAEFSVALEEEWKSSYRTLLSVYNGPPCSRLHVQR